MTTRFRQAATYFNGYTCTRVTGDADGFSIVFGDGAAKGAIESNAPGEVPGFVNASTLRSVDYGDDDATVTVLDFGRDRLVALDKQSYSVTHPACGTVYPERTEDGG